MNVVFYPVLCLCFSMKNLVAVAALLVGVSVFAGETCKFEEVPKGTYFGISNFVTKTRPRQMELVHQIQVISGRNLQMNLLLVGKERSGDRVVGSLFEFPLVTYSFDRASCEINVVYHAKMELKSVKFSGEGEPKATVSVLSETDAEKLSFTDSLQERDAKMLIHLAAHDVDLILQQDEKVDWEQVVSSFKEKHPDLKLSAIDVDKIKSLMGVGFESTPGLEMLPADGISEMVMLKDKNAARGMSLTLVAFMFAALLF